MVTAAVITLASVIATGMANGVIRLNVTQMAARMVVTVWLLDTVLVHMATVVKDVMKVREKQFAF